MQRQVRFFFVRVAMMAKGIKVTESYSTENRWPLGAKSSQMETAERQIKRKTSTNEMDGWPGFTRVHLQCESLSTGGLWGYMSVVEILQLT